MEQIDETMPRKLSLYIHIPFCKEKCQYCDFLSFGGCGYNEQRQYIDALIKEITTYGTIASDYWIDTIFIGGGTPSYIQGEWIVEVLDAVRNTFCVSEHAEITIEGNPDSLTRENLAVYRRGGINRLSIGLQSANDEMLKVLGRVHNFDQFVAAFNSARQAGFNNINVDIMSGLPGESMESYIRTLAKVVDMQPEHISAYSLIVEENTPLAVNEELCAMLPSEELDRQMYARTKMLLQNSGYNRYEISNYAKEGFECRHNLVYWTGGEYLGVGLGASSYMKVFVNDEWKTIRFHGVENRTEYVGRFLQCEGMREDEYTGLFHAMEDFEEDMYSYYYETSQAGMQNLEEYRGYEESVFLEFVRDYYKDLYICKRKDEMEEMMFLGLRTIKGVSKQDFKNRFGVSMDNVYGTVIAKYMERGLLGEEEDRLFLTDRGIDVSNIVMADFML